ncbi:ARM repeat-containing protein [Meredithblackwellia eburnea MCA 4105]
MFGGQKSQQSYATSSALSPAHYRLTTALEQATSNKATADIILKELETIKNNLQSPNISPKSTRINILLALHCHNTSRLLPGPSSIHVDPYDISFVLPFAVKLAGGAGSTGTLADRRVAYQVCQHVFSRQSHPLKLLLINTIRSDLYVPSTHPDSEDRWLMGLKAASSPTLITPELIPAISDRVLELFNWRTAVVRRAALGTLLALVETMPGSLVNGTRSLVLSALSPPLAADKPPHLNTSTTRKLKGKGKLHRTPSFSSTASSSSPKSSRSRSRSKPPSAASQPVQPRTHEPDPRNLRALVQATMAGSPIHPVLSRDRRGELLLAYLAVLARLVGAGEWREFRWEYHGVRCGWLADTVLRAVGEVLRLDAEDGMEEGKLEEALKVDAIRGVLSYLDSILDKVDLAFGLLLSAAGCFTTFSASTLNSLAAPWSQVLNRVLSTIRNHLNSKNVNLQVLSVRCLALLPLDLWSGEGRDEWDERAWARIMSFLGAKDSFLRKETLKLLQKADPKLADMHVSRIFNALQAAPAPTKAAEQASKDHLVTLLLEASSVVDTTSSAWVGRLESIVSAARGTREAREVLPTVVLVTLERFEAASNQEKEEFGDGVIGSELWQNDLTLALLVAATAGQGTASTERKEQVATILSTWLAEALEQLPSDFLLPLHEPFVLCLLRLASQIPVISLDSIENNLSKALQGAPPELVPMYELFGMCRSDPDKRRALEAAGVDNRSSTLPGFHSALLDHLEHPEVLEDTTDEGAFSSQSATSPTEPSNPVPLRYDPYQAPVSTTTPRGRSGPQMLKDRERSKSWKRREKERIERGGRGGIAESLMTPGALALLGVGEDDDDDSDTDSDSSRAHFRRATEQEPAIALSNEPSGQEDSSFEQGDSSATEDPPADLLIDMSLNANDSPFHDGA